LSTWFAAAWFAAAWFAAAWFVTAQKNGVSALALQRMLGFGSYETAWAWMQKLRRAMVRLDRDQLNGIVELDETFVGGRSSGKLGASSDKVPVMVAVERVGPHRLGLVRFGIDDRPGTRKLVQFACDTITEGTTVRTDGARMLRRLTTLGYTHEYVNGYASPDPAPNCPACTWSPHCSSAGSPALRNLSSQMRQLVLTRLVMPVRRAG